MLRYGITHGRRSARLSFGLGRSSFVSVRSSAASCLHPIGRAFFFHSCIFLCRHRASMIVSLPSASSTENVHALEEVQDFATTDMGDPEGGTWTYRVLPEPLLSQELARMAQAAILPSTQTHHITFQPCSPLEHENQDRLVSEKWDIPQHGSWTFNAVFDGHVNGHTVDYVVQNFPRILRRNLVAALETVSRPSASSDDGISRVLRDSVVYLDDQIWYDLVDALPNDWESAPPDTLVRHFSGDKRAYDCAARCLGGCTAVFALTEPTRRRAWVVNLGGKFFACAARKVGAYLSRCVCDYARHFTPIKRAMSAPDSHAAVVRRSGSAVAGVHVNNLHNARSADEVALIRSLHPAEPSVFADDRVLGYLEPTRGFGDVWLKRPRLASLLMSVSQEWLSSTSLVDYGSQVLTPPYVLNTPDVHEIHLDEPDVDDYFLVLATDGLADCGTYEHLEPPQLASAWAEVLRTAIEDDHAKGLSSNLALSLLRAALGGSDEREVSQNMTVEMDDRWMDDTTILVQRIPRSR
ncbi:phosphatase 2C-like domain-containing protein [Schizophyllum amplum]|uniref:Phosphatase 2C-like domain-containing protein n=1 Tax=Schizophyllum amplum TaxID=97359 RepID=A0A550CY29_9AGAR|nr:phosphatase 2C-like domain-containing protein [Auriculariopsis ampla]